MQGQRNAGNSYVGTVDLNNGTDKVSLDQSTDLNSSPNPIESQLSNHMPLAEGNYTYGNAVSHGVRGFSGWDFGESSSHVNPQSQAIGDGLKSETSCSSLFLARLGSEARLEDRQLDQSNIILCDSVNNGIGDNQVTGRPLITQSSSSSCAPLNINLNAGMGSSGDVGQGMGPGACHNLYKINGPGAEIILNTNASSDNVGTSCGNSGYLVDNEGGSGSSLSNFGSSCKRKALEGTSGQSYTGGSSSSNYFQQAEIFPRHGVFACYNAPGSLSISSPSVVSHSFGQEQLNSGSSDSMCGAASDVFPPLNVTGISECSSRNFGIGGNTEHHESVRLNLPSPDNSIRQSDVCSPNQLSRPLTFTDSLDLRPTTSVATTSNNPPSQSHSLHIPDLSRNMRPFPWHRSLNSRSGSSSSSLMLLGDTGASLQEESNFRSTLRNSMVHHHMFAPPTETRNLVQDPNNWNLPTGNSSTSANIPSSSRTRPSSIRPFPGAWIPRHNTPTQNQQRLSEFAPWTLFPSVDLDSGGQRGRFPTLHSGPSSAEETMMLQASSQGHHPSYPRTSLLMEVPADDVNGWHPLAADIEGRQALVSEVRHALNAMRRGQNLRSEDYALFDPFINGAELHDRHRDMRLDVDNMSYEELLALEEHIGNVSTGLSEETIMESMQKRKYLSIMEGSQSNLEPCSICQEEYVTGDNIGTLNCGHDFHSNCIKQWLILKNICPICKTTALGT